MGNVKRFIESGEYLRAGKGQPETLLSLIRNQQARGSNPRAGSINIKGLAEIANLFFIKDNLKEILINFFFYQNHL